MNIVNKKIKIVGICGSLRKESYNKRLLLSIKELMKDEIALEIVDISMIPPFNEDVEKEEIPQEVVNFKNKLREADAFVIATPEYNHSIPGVLKNALDWASRGENLPLANKPVAIMSASIGFFGGPRVQSHLRQVCACLNMHVVNKPEVFVVDATEKFDENNNLIDEKAKQYIIVLIRELIKMTKTLNN